jgi:hypothetical protein
MGSTGVIPGTFINDMVIKNITNQLFICKKYEYSVKQTVTRFGIGDWFDIGPKPVGLSTNAV